MFTLSDALTIAINTHRGQKDKGGVDYIEHPLYLYHKIKMKGGSKELKMVAIMHDVVEDGDDTISFTGLKDLGCPESVVEALVLLTHEPDSEEFLETRIVAFITGGCSTEEAILKVEEISYINYIEKLSGNDMARAVKIEDLRHNSDIRRIKGGRGLSKEDSFRILKYAKALRILTGGKVGYT